MCVNTSIKTIGAKTLVANPVCEHSVHIKFVVKSAQIASVMLPKFLLNELCNLTIETFFTVSGHFPVHENVSAYDGQSDNSVEIILLMVELQLSSVSIVGLSTTISALFRFIVFILALHEI